MLKSRSLAIFLVFTLFATGLSAQIVYYGSTKVNFNNSGAANPNSTEMRITGITDGTTYTLTNLNTATVIASGNVNRGQISLVSALADNSRSLADRRCHFRGPGPGVIRCIADLPPRLMARSGSVKQSSHRPHRCADHQTDQKIAFVRLFHLFLP